MNPTALVLLVLALALLVIAFKGTQDNFMSAALGRPWSSTQHITGTGTTAASSNSAGAPAQGTLA